MSLLGNLMIISKILLNYIKPLILLKLKKTDSMYYGLSEIEKLTQKETGKHSRCVTSQELKTIRPDVFCIITSYSAEQTISREMRRFLP